MKVHEESVYGGEQILPNSPASMGSTLVCPSSSQISKTDIETNSEILSKASLMNTCIEREVSPNSPATAGPVMKSCVKSVKDGESTLSSQIPEIQNEHLVERGEEVLPNSSANSSSSSESSEDVNESLSSPPGTLDGYYFQKPKPDFETYSDYMTVKDGILYPEDNLPRSQISETDSEILLISPMARACPILQREETPNSPATSEPVIKARVKEVKDEEIIPNSPVTLISPLFSPSSSQISESEILVRAVGLNAIVEREKEVLPNISATCSSSSQSSENFDESLGSPPATLDGHYFQMPKPDFETYSDYMTVKDGILYPEDKKRVPISSKYIPIPSEEPADSGIAEFSAKRPHEFQHTHSKCNKEVSRTSTSKEYCKAISSIGEMEESKSPGFKRLALKELLKKQINEKKFAAFNRSKEISNLDENEKVESDESGSEEGEKYLKCQVENDSETSDEDIEEQTVSFPFEHEKNNVEAEDSDESDEDISIAKKKYPKRLEISDDDDDSILPEITTDIVHDMEKYNNERNEADFEGEISDIPSYQPFVEDSLIGIEKACSPHSLASEISRSFEEDNNLNFEGSNLSNVPSLPMDDPPILLTENGSAMENIFLSQDLAAVCSGSFNSKAENNKEISLLHERKQIYNTYEESPVKEKINEFIDLEAELSGEDDGEDDPDSDGEGVEDLIASDDELPSNKELRDEIVGLHMKHLNDEDDEILKGYKEKFLDDGELHNDGRTRRFAWKNAVDVDDTKKDCSSSESEDEIPDSSMNVGKAQWLEENKEEELAGNFSSSSRHLLNIEILGKPKFAQDVEDSPRRLSCKRPRGSYLHFDTADQVLKKLKTEEEYDGSRVTKHCLFPDDDIKANVIKEIPKKSTSVLTVTTDISSVSPTVSLASDTIFSKM